MSEEFRITVRRSAPTINMKTQILNYDDSLYRDIHPTIILQIGAGGTGSYVVPEIMRYIGSLPVKLREKIFYAIMDGDEFEEKNIDRQNCIEEDLGKNKAVAMIDAFASYYNISYRNVKAVPKYLTCVQDIYEAMQFDHENLVYTGFDGKTKPDFSNASSHITTHVHVILIDCVDKTTPRSIINMFMKCHYSEKYNNSISDIYLISSGNGKFSGQVGIGRYVYKSFGNAGIDGVTAVDILRKEVENCYKPCFYLEDSSKWQYVDNTLKDIYKCYIDRDISVTPRVGNNVVSIDANFFGYSHTVHSVTVNQDSGRILSIELEKNKEYITPERALSCFVNTKLPYDRYPELVDVSIDEEEEQLSCADRAAQNVQSIQANKTASNLICNYVLDILGSRYPIDNSKHSGIRYHTVTFDAESNQFNSIPFTVDDILSE